MTDAQVEGAPAPQEDAAIRIDDLVVNYGRKRAVDGLSLTVPRGTVYGFLGPNGAGKTSTIKTFMGFRKPDGEARRCSVTPSSKGAWGCGRGSGSPARSTASTRG